MGERGITPVVGLTILVGIGAVVAVSILVVSGAFLDGAQSSAEVQQVEYSMSQFSQTTERLAAGDTKRGSYTPPDDRSGTTSVDESAGHMEIVLVHADGSTETLTSQDLGVYRHEFPDGTEVAFQGGGVWRTTGEHTKLVDPPAFQYRSRPESTLTFPNVRLTGNGSQQSGEGKLRVTERRELFPANHTNPIEGTNLYVTIQSEYCDGWEAHVDERTDGTVEESCSESDATSAPNELRVNMTIPNGDGGPLHDGVGLYSESGIEAWDASLDVNATFGAGDDVTIHSNTSFTHDGAIGEGVGELRDPHDEEIYDLVSEANASDWEAFCGGNRYDFNCEYEGNQTLYIDDPVYGAGDVTFDLAKGNLTIVIKGDLTTKDTTYWRLKNYTGKSVNVYVTGDISFTETTGIGPDAGPDTLEPTIDPPEDTYPEGFQFYGTSDATITVKDTFEAQTIISAPSAGTSNTSYADVQGTSVKLIGSIYAGDMDIYSGTLAIYQPPRLGAGDTSEIESIAGPEPELHYLHLSEVVLDVQG